MDSIQLNKAMFLELLEDEEVKEKILQITNRQNKHIENSENINQDIKKLQETLQSKESEIERFSKEIINQNEQINNYKLTIEECKRENNKLKQEIQEINDILIKEKMKYEEISHVYNLYENLNDEIKEEIKGIFKNQGLENFIFCGAQFENIQMLWDYIRKKMIENEYTCLENLKFIFDYFFNQYNKIYEEEIYCRLNVNLEDIFDTEIHTRSSNSKASGNIKEVLLKGYKNKYTNKVERKSVVRL